MCKGRRWCCDIVLTSTTALWLQFFHLMSVLVSLSLKFHFLMFHILYIVSYLHISIMCLFYVWNHVMSFRSWSMFSEHACQGDQHLQMKLKVTFCMDTLVSHFLQVLSRWRRARSAPYDVISPFPVFSTVDSSSLSGLCRTMMEKTDHVQNTSENIAENTSWWTSNGKP